ncbi:hypothetical protein D9C73_001872 [Collichthys lucidus]|uniref:DUF4592 domain-containing protein n=1 Tax=Collichthys lucidus TaxID=240159 RepID=A0A4U5U1U5_COLLU|nr:hypothetical protein D9C73_001872 [Collichthys lucidus]
MSRDKRKTAEVSSAFGSGVHQQVQVETENTRGIRRPTPGSGSFYSSITTAKNQDGQRPRSGSFVGVLEQTEARHRVEDKPFASFKEKPEPRGPSVAVGRLRQVGAPAKSSGLPRDRKDSLTKVDSVTPSKNITTDTGAVKEVESSHELDEAAEVQEVEEDEGKRAFGIKLRSTSHSIKFRPDVSSNLNSKPPASEEPCDKQKRQETNNSASFTCKKLSTNIFGTTSTPGDLRQSDPAPSSFSLPVKHNPPSICLPPVMPSEPQTTSMNPKEVEASLTAPQEPTPAPQSTPPEVSWMSLAMEKTRSLQQLLARRLPRDFTGVQTVTRPQAQVQTTNQAETVTVKSTTPVETANQASIDVVKAETVQSRSPAQTVKPSLIAMQQKMSTASPVQSNTSREPQTSKQTNELQSHSNTPQSTSQSASMQTNRWTTQPPLHSPVQTEASPQFAQGSVPQSLAQSYLSSGQQQPPWSNRGVPPAAQLKPATSVSTTSSARAPPPVYALAKGEREPSVVQEKDGGSLSGRGAVWAGSVSGKAAFLEKRAEWTTPPGNKGVEVKKARTEAQTSGESAATAKTTPLSKDAQPEGRPGLKPAESSPTKIPDRPREDKWLRKNAPSSSLPSSSSPTMPSALQSMSDSSQPSWMELAKRKSRAWNDKAMD